MATTTISNNGFKFNERSDIVIVGSCMIDLVSYVPRLPIAGETIHATKFKQGFGGKGANQCVAAAKLGASTALIAKLGADSFGESYLNELKKYKTINTKYVQLVENETSGIASISVASNGENQIVIASGANSTLSSTDIDNAFELLVQAKVVVFQGETPWETTLYCLEKLKQTSEFKGTTIVNAAPAISNLNSKIYSLCDIFCVNEIEAEILTKMKNYSGNIKLLLNNNCNTVIITLGGNGVLYDTNKNKNDNNVNNFGNTVNVDKIECPVDTTGAGDCFIGALSYYLCYYSQLSLDKIISRSCSVARLSVLKYGTHESFPYKEELDETLFLLK